MLPLAAMIRETLYPVTRKLMSAGCSHVKAMVSAVAVAVKLRTGPVRNKILKDCLYGGVAPQNAIVTLVQK